MFNFRQTTNITFFKFRHYIFISVFGLITLYLVGCDDTPNFEGDKIIGTWVLNKSINTLDETIDEFDISEMKNITIFYINGRFKKTTDEGSLSRGEWRNLGNGYNRFSNGSWGLLNWSSDIEVEFIGDNEMAYGQVPFLEYIINYYSKIE